MTNKEILAELKQCYEYINDILDNEYGQLIEKERINLSKMLSNLYDTYFDLYNRIIITEDLSIPKQYQNDDNEIILIGENPCADYTIQNKNTGIIDESFITCEDLGYYWYQDNKFINN